jgi:hypothetical protein
MKRETKQRRNTVKDETGRSFRAPRSSSSGSCSLIAARSIAFSRRLVSAGSRLPAAKIPAFLEYVFGVRATFSALRGFQGELVLKSSGHRSHQSFQTLIVKPVLSLTVNWLLSPLSSWFGSSFSSWLSQVYTAETTLKTEKEIHSFSARQTTKIKRVFLKQFIAGAESSPNGRLRQTAPVSASATPLTRRAIWIPVESERLRQSAPVSVSATPLTRRTRCIPVGNERTNERTKAKPGGRPSPIYVSSTTGRTIPGKAAAVFMPWPGLNTVSILSLVSQGGATVHRFHSSGIGTAVVKSRDFIVVRPRGERERPDWQQPLYGFREVRERRGAERSSVIFKQPALYLISPSTAYRSGSPAQQAYRQSVSRRPEAVAGGGRWFGSTSWRSYELVSKEITSLRREEQLQRPPQTYAYAQPIRPVMEEEQVIKREREIVEIVRKEVETSINSRSPMTELSRADYSRITDHVWFALSRRLMKEKERLGHGY